MTHDHLLCNPPHSIQRLIKWILLPRIRIHCRCCSIKISIWTEKTLVNRDEGNDDFEQPNTASPTTNNFIPTTCGGASTNNSTCIILLTFCIFGLKITCFVAHAISISWMNQMVFFHERQQQTKQFYTWNGGLCGGASEILLIMSKESE